MLSCRERWLCGSCGHCTRAWKLGSWTDLHSEEGLICLFGGAHGTAGRGCPGGRNCRPKCCDSPVQFNTKPARHAAPTQTKSTRATSEASPSAEQAFPSHSAAAPLSSPHDSPAHSGQPPHSQGWPRRGGQAVRFSSQESSLQAVGSLRQTCVYPFPSFPCSTAWKKNVMAGAASALLNHETSGAERQRTLGPCWHRKANPQPTSLM